MINMVVQTPRCCCVAPSIGERLSFPCPGSRERFFLPRRGNYDGNQLAMALLLSVE